MKREDKLFQVIARRSLSLGDAAWLKENISEKWDWPSVEERIFQEGLSALFYSHLRSLDLLSFLPGDMRKRLGRIYAETSLINRHLLKILETLEEALAERNMKVIVFKGAALLNTVYRDPALRPMEDIDLIVREEQLGVLKEILETMGFVQNGLYPYTFSKGILSVDLHRDFISSHRIGSRREILNIHAEDLWKRAVPLSGSRSLYRLSLPDELTALSFHLLKHRYERLMWFVDLAEVLKDVEASWAWPDVIASSRQARSERVLLYALLLARHLIDVDIPDDVLDDLGKERLARIEKYLLRLRLMNVPLGTAADLLWMFQIRGAAGKIHFVMENVFPKREVMMQIFPSSSHPAGTSFRRAVLIFLRVAGDLLSSARFVLKTGLPPL
jgi:hypothetical protein